MNAITDDLSIPARIARLGLVLMRDPCRAALWDIRDGEVCPVCGALPDTKCKAMEERR